MINTESQQFQLESIWMIPAIFEGLREYSQKWVIYSPKCNPFWGNASVMGECVSVFTASRGVTLACEDNKPAVVFVPNRQVANVYNLASKATVSNALVLVVEDNPLLAPQIYPREFAKRAGLSVVEPCNPDEVLHCALAAANISASTSEAVVLIAHHGLLSSSATIDRSLSEELQHYRQAELMSPIRLGRKFELNKQRSLPSPGEKMSVGFVTVGMSDPALKYLVHELQLFGRVPMLNLRLIHPIDAVPVERLISRCRLVVVLEPRPGEVEQEIVSIAQSLQREGGEVAAIWGSVLPPIDPELDPVKVPDDSLHPSVVARLTQHLLQEVKPSVEINKQLLQQIQPLGIRPSTQLSFGTEAALNLLKEVAVRVLGGIESSPHFIIDGEHYNDDTDEVVYVETWGEQNFIAAGAGVIRDSRWQRQTRIMLVWNCSKADNILSAIVDSVASEKGDGHSSVVYVSLDNSEDLDIAIEEASTKKGLSIIIVSDGSELRFDVEQLSLDAQEIDLLGFRPQHAIVIPIEQMASVRHEPIELWNPKAGIPAMPLESSLSIRRAQPKSRKWRISLRPILERVEVTRTKPPVRVVTETTKRLTPPQPIHASSPVWRVHIAGYRGDQPGVVGKVLLEAGRQMGHEVCSQCDNTSVGAGRNAWAQILFTGRRTKRSFRQLVASIPWGEADVLIGWDREEVLHAIDPTGSLQVASPDRTYAIINIDPLEKQLALEDVDGMPRTIDVDTIGKSCDAEVSVLRSFASLARYRFHNERLGDLIQLGMTFQLGLIPVTVDAMNAAIEKVEEDGFARTKEAFDFGRRAALDPETAWQPIKEEFQVDLSRLIKRTIRDYYILGKRGVAKGNMMQRFIRQVHQSLPGLSETVEGRQALVDLINGLRRCMLWGGEETTSHFVQLVCKLYAVDRADKGRELTRRAILPLAESILIRDPVYLARLARSPEILRRIRNRLNVRHSRGDTLKRRFLSRLRLRFWNWSVQIDMRTSDWSSVLASGIGSVVPKRMRGHRRDREVRELIQHAVTQATVEPEMYELWVARFHTLHRLAIEGELHTVSVEEIKEILVKEPEAFHA